MRILVIEDDEDIAALLKQGLERAGHAVVVAPSAASGWEHVVNELFGLVILDLMLPDGDGNALCERIRSRQITVPVLMLTARDELRSRVRGLDAGADDYLTKPFEFEELLARVRALTRRNSLHKTRRIRIADMEIDTGLRRVVRDGREIHLTPREYALLESLAMRQGQTFTREVIQEIVWFGATILSNTVDVHVATLRRKVDTGFAVKLIETIPRIGYRIAIADDRDISQ